MGNKVKAFYVAASLLAISAIQGCSSEAERSNSPRIGGQGNPADVYCVESGGKVIPKQNAQGAYSLCSFPDGVQVDTWELYRANHKG
ncbi:hypothetical protein SOASR030_02890 [Leminorella grimontii]|uniref:DUF333 domain-containing protein n=1 Tax=Leminorella grimontii TaxID=82981 RepID=A0AAV5N0I6_9GAMM|nr:DUF333 domain-containing protein [Leminorella grimontii]KFC95643.1 putative hemolysin [Leminorella grimontii ATCC 33999 = DSM 5078]GKX54177.1 hypothetical protein SOASR030_02890 [Leminorella grimontii]GKX60582.1 hypothetical protein SOASR031_28970 [Leminorella grimontii]VFS59847.1 Putative hemolysin [Leminorella grimontii]